MDIKKQIDYWVTTSQDDIETAELLINNKKVIQGLFFCHRSVENF